MQTPDPMTAPNPHLPARPDWLALRREEILEPELPIVDPHHHLVDRANTGRYLLPELLDDTNTGHNIVATVYLEWLSMYRQDGPPEMRPVGEVEFANGVAAMAASGLYGKTRVCAGIVGHADLMLGAPVETVLETMIAAGGGRFRGIRYITASHPSEAARGSSVNRPAGLLKEPRVREGFAKLHPLGLSFDAWMYFTQLGELADLARAFPATPIVLNHVGGAIGIGPYAGTPRRGFYRVAPRDRGGRAAARTCTSSSAGSGCGCSASTCMPATLPPSSEQLATAWRPYIETCIAAFGPERAMFESNFPVDKGSGSYPVFWNAFKRIAAGCSAAEKEALFSGTARRFYRLD